MFITIPPVACYPVEKSFSNRPNLFLYFQYKKHTRLLLTIVITSLLFSCSSKEESRFACYNATIYTVDSSFSTAEAMVVSDGKIIATGKTADLEKKYDAKEKLDAQGKFIYPGFIDAHAHFAGYGKSLQTVNLVGTQSWTK